jgi:cytochrome c peroxidase
MPVRNLLAFTLFLASNLSAQYSPLNPWWDAIQGGTLPRSQDWDNPYGQLRVLNITGDIPAQNNPFFTPMGPNGRACITCHQPANAMTVGTALLQRRWNESQGKDPVFAAVDGSNCPSLPQTPMTSHSLLLNRGLFRIGLPWPPKNADGTAMTPEFQIEVVNDPTGCNTSSVYGVNSAQPTISVYRRPRVAANLQYVAGLSGMNLMADGRETSLQSQATGAANIHEEAPTPLTPDQLDQIVKFEMQVFSAQNWDIHGGTLNDPSNPLSLGVDNLSSGAAGADSVPVASDAFDAWRNLAGLTSLQQIFRASAVRGIDIFLSRQFELAPGVLGTCASCHQPGTARWMDIGTTNQPTAKDSPELPLFKITCDGSAPPHPTLGSIIYTQDPGRALISGKCADVGSILMQQFRGLAARAPYFSNGSAATLADLVDFYDRRFAIGLSDQDKQDLVNLLSIF